MVEQADLAKGLSGYRICQFRMQVSFIALYTQF